MLKPEEFQAIREFILKRISFLDLLEGNYERKTVEKKVMTFKRMVPTRGKTVLIKDILKVELSAGLRDIDVDYVQHKK